jgi:Multiubiquitin
MIDDNAEDGAERKELEDVERLLKDAAREGEIVKEAAEKQAADLTEAEHELEALRHPPTVTIIVDGTPHQVPRREHITYVEVVTLAYPDYPHHPEISYSVTYTKGPIEKPEGIVSPGGSVKVKEGMVFRVNRTGQS